jgi:hypothetical protein
VIMRSMTATGIAGLKAASFAVVSGLGRRAQGSCSVRSRGARTSGGQQGCYVRREMGCAGHAAADPQLG